MWKALALLLVPARSPAASGREPQDRGRSTSPARTAGSWSASSCSTLSTTRCSSGSRAASPPSSRSPSASSIRGRGGSTTCSSAPRSRWSPCTTRSTREYLVNYKLDGRLIESRVVNDLDQLERAMTLIHSLPAFELQEELPPARIQLTVRAQLGSKPILFLFPNQIDTDWARSWLGGADAAASPRMSPLSLRERLLRHRKDNRLIFGVLAGALLFFTLVYYLILRSQETPVGLRDQQPAPVRSPLHQRRPHPGACCSSCCATCSSCGSSASTARSARSSRPSWSRPTSRSRCCPVLLLFAYATELIQGSVERTLPHPGAPGAGAGQRGLAGAHVADRRLESARRRPRAGRGRRARRRRSAPAPAPRRHPHPPAARGGPRLAAGLSGDAVRPRRARPQRGTGPASRAGVGLPARRPSARAARCA